MGGSVALVSARRYSTDRHRVRSQLENIAQICFLNRDQPRVPRSPGVVQQVLGVVALDRHCPAQLLEQCLDAEPAAAATAYPLTSEGNQGVVDGGIGGVQPLECRSLRAEHGD